MDIKNKENTTTFDEPIMDNQNILLTPCIINLKNIIRIVVKILKSFSNSSV